MTDQTAFQIYNIAGAFKSLMSQQVNLNANPLPYQENLLVEVSRYQQIGLWRVNLDLKIFQ